MSVRIEGVCVIGFWLLGVLGVVILALSLFFDRRRCFRRGFRRGHEHGWKAAKEWIVEIETEIDRERQRIWREGN